MPLKDMYRAGKCRNKVSFYCSFFSQVAVTEKKHKVISKHSYIQETVMGPITTFQIQVY